MASKQFEFILNFSTQFDKGKLNEALSQLKTIVDQNKLKVGFDKDNVSKEFEQLGKAVQQISQNAKALDLDIDISDVIKDFDKLSVQIEKSLETDLGKVFENVDLTKLDKSVQEIDKAFENIDLDTLQEAFENLDPAKAFGDSFEDALKKNKAKTTELESALAKMVAEGKKGTPEFAKMEKELKLAKDEADQIDDALKKVTKEAGNAESFISKMATFGLASQGIQSVASGLQDLAQPFIALDTATANLKTLGDEAAAMAPNLQKAAIEMSTNLPFAAAEMQSTMFDALASGVKGGEAGLKSFAETAGKLAVGGGADLGATTGLLASTLNAYSQGAEKAGQLSDILFNTINYGVTSVDQMAGSFANVIPTASSLGLEIENVGGALAVMTAKGIPTAQSTTKLNALLIELAKPGATLAPILTKAGVSLESLKQDDLPVTLSKINQALKETGKASIEVFSSSEAGAAFATLAGDIEGFAQTFKDVRDTTGSAENAYNQMADSVEVRTKQIQTKMEALLINGFGKLGNSFTVVASASAQLAPTVTTMVGLGQALPIDKMKQFGTSALGVAKNFTSLNGTKLNFGQLKSGLDGIKGQMSSLGPTLLNPWLIAGVGLTLFLTQTKQGQATLDKLGEKGKEILQKLEPLGKFFGTVLFSAFDGLSELIEAFVDTIGDYFTAVLDILTAIGDMTGISTLLGSLFNTAESGASSFDKTSSAIEYLFDLLKLFPLSISVVLASISGIAKNAPEIIEAFVEYAKVMLNPANWFGEDGEAEKKAKDRLSNVMDKALSGARDKISTFKLGETLDKAMDSKVKIDKSDELKKLTKEFQTTADEIKRAEIATKIAEMAPDAVKGYRSIVNAQGEVVQVADINIKKANELAEAQKKTASSEVANAQKSYTKSLQDQANEYDKMKTKASELAKKIIEDGKKGIDTKESVKQYEKLQSEITDKSKNISKTLGDATKVGFTVADVNLPDSFKSDFADQIDKVVKSPEVIQAGQGIDEVLKLKGEIGSEFSLNSLQEKLKNAKTEAEKSNIAKAIASQAPEAVKAVGTVIDENGQMITQYQVAGDKVQEYANKAETALKDKIVKAQQKVQDSISKEANSYEDLRKQAEKKQKEINEARSKGFDTTELEKQQKQLNDKLNSNGTELLNTLAKAKNAGVENSQAVEVLAKQLGKTPDEVRKMVDKQQESIKKAEQQKQSVSQLASEWDKAKSGVDGLVKSQVSALAEVNKQLQNKNITKELRENLELQRKDIIKTGKEAVAQSKALTKLGEEAEKTLGAGPTEKAKTSLELAKEQFDKIKAKYDLEKQSFQNIQDMNILEEKRKRNSNDDLALNTKTFEIALKMKDEYIKIAKQRKLISEIKDDGQIVFAPKVKDVEQTEILTTIANLEKGIIDTEKGGFEIDAKIKTDKEEIQKIIDDIERQKFQAELEIGLITNEDLFIKTQENFKKEAIKIEQELAEIKQKIEKDTNKLNEKENLNALKSVMDKKLNNEKAIRDAIKNEYNRQIADIKDLEQKKLDAVQSSFDSQINALNRFVDTYSGVYQAGLDDEKNSRLQGLDERLNSEKERLDRFKEIGTISEYEYNKRIEEINANSEQRRANLEEEYRKKSIILQATAEGQKLEEQRKLEANKAKIQEDSFNKQLSTFQKTFGITDDNYTKLIEAQREFNEANQSYLEDSLSEEKKANKERAEQSLKNLGVSLKLNEEQLKALQDNVGGLDNAKKLFEEKGSDLGLLANQLQDNIQDTISTLFAGDEEALVENARKLFSQLAGIIQRKISAFVLELVLSPGTIKYLSALPFPLNVLSVPTITATANATVKAITDPILQSILSFSSGGRVDSPTLAVIGDGAKLGSANREWIFNDPQLISTIQMATVGSNKMLADRLGVLESILTSQEITTQLRGEDIRISLKRTNARMKARKR